MDFKDYSTLKPFLICDIVHKDCQADASALEETKNGFHYKGQYS